MGSVTLEGVRKAFGLRVIIPSAELGIRAGDTVRLRPNHGHIHRFDRQGQAIH